MIRYGRYGRSIDKRQRYQCTPKGDGDQHYFTQPLPREWVDVGVEACATCYDLLTPHQGEMAASRRSPWALRDIVACLNNLSLGSSYAQTSLDLRARGRALDMHLASVHGVLLPAGLPELRSGSATGRAGRGAWHLAADVVEQYAPVLSAYTMNAVLDRERKRRRVNDAALRRDPSGRLAQPIVYILDELPIIIRRRPSKQAKAAATRVQSSQYSLLVVVEIVWRRGKAGQVLPDREGRLRLVRAYPRANEEAWRLVLDELGTRPDFVVADCAPAISNAVRSQWVEQVGLIPSFFHISRNLREALVKLPRAATAVDKRMVLIPSLDKHLDALSRDEALNLSARDWSSWWDELLTAVRALPAPDIGVVHQRGIYEPRIAEALPLLRAQPQLPASNAGVEARIRLTLDPFLEGRKGRYRNLARTNFLLDLAVCRAQGLFLDLDLVGKLIREHNSAVRGWALAPRTLTDAQPPSGAPVVAGAGKQIYSSLLNPFLVKALATKRLGGKP